MATRFPAGIADMKISDFANYSLGELSVGDLELLEQRCLAAILSGTSTGNELDAAKAMLPMIASHRTFRASRTTRRGMIVWSILTVLALLAVGLLQAYVLYSTSYSPQSDDEDAGGRCEQQEYEI